MAENKTVAVSSLKIGDRFSWIPAEWYGPCRLISKTKRVVSDGRIIAGGFVMEYTGKYDLKFDAAVVNHPGVTYGVLGTTKVRKLRRK